MKVISIPERSELLTRLAAVNNEPHMGVFHRVLAYNLAGKTLDGDGIANAMAQSMEVYTSDHPTEMTAAVRRTLAEYVPAITGDIEVQGEVQSSLKAAGFFVGSQTGRRVQR